MPTYNYSDIVQYNNFFDEADYNVIKEKTGFGSHWQYGHTSLGNKDPNFAKSVPFWQISFQEDTFFTEHLLNKIQQKLDTSFSLERVYANGHTYGLDGCIHVDAHDPLGHTLLLYVNPHWEYSWGGATNFHINEGEMFSVFPTGNKAVYFPGQIPHCASGTTRHFKFLRVTIAWKLRKHE